MNNNIKSFIRNLIQTYSSYSSDTEGFYMSYYDICDFELSELSAMIMESDPEFSSCATGPDNLLYESVMAPALIKYMANVTDKDQQIEFRNTWNASIIKHHKSMVEGLLSDELYEYNEYYGCNDKARDRALREPRHTL